MDNEQRNIAQKKNSAAGQKTAAEPLPTHARNSNGLATTVPAEKSVLVENIDVASTVVSLLADDVRPHFTPTDGLRVPALARRPQLEVLALRQLRDLNGRGLDGFGSHEPR